MLVTNESLSRSFTRSTNIQAFRQVAYIALLLAGLCLVAVPARAQVSGQNVNMVSGTNWTNGDPFLQRQNEPSIAVSSRNSSHLLAGANDYRTVDLPGALGIDERGDAWLGLFKSFDGGRTWQSTLLPGFPLDGSPQGQASPIHGFQAASDPTVRAGTNGLFYYTGLAFNRVGNLPKSAVFVSRLIDLNNKENGDATFESGSITNLQPRDTIRYVDTTVVDRGGIPGTPGASTFLDKPWVAVDIPRGGATCTISVTEDGKTITQTIPAAPVYMTYTSFVGNGPLQRSTINFRRSLDCGATWSSPAILSQNDEPSGVADGEHQGTVVAIDPSVPPSQPATVYVAWRRFASASDPDEPPAIFLAKSADGGAHWGTAFPVVVFPSSCISKPAGVGCPFDQIFTNTSFRSNGYPALTVDSNGRVYIAWSQRDTNGDGKIMMGIAPGGRSIQSASIAPVDIGSVADDDGNAFSNLSGHGSQLMPSLSFEAGKLVLAYYDLRQDHTTGTFVQKPDPNCDSLITLPCILGGQYLESRTLEGELGPPNPPNNPAVFSSYVADSAPPLAVRRHTIDVMGAEAVPPPASSLQAPSFKTFRITHYLFGSIPQLFQDVEQIQFNAPNLPLFVDGTAPFMGDYIDVSGTPQIIADGNGGWTFNTNPTANPVFHAAWTDNRDVVPPADGNWQNYTPPISASNPGGQPSKFDPTKQPLVCVVGQTGMRNQNIYTAEISQGVVLTSPQTSKPVLTPAGQPIQRAFVVELRNASNAARSFQVNIPTQPATATASFSQFFGMTAQTVKVNAFSSQSFPVFVVANAGSTVPFPSVLVTATENDGSNPPLTGSVLLNPDPTNPALTNPDNAAIGANQISVNEFYNPGVANPGVANSGVPNPGVANPGVANPGVANPGVANPTVVVALNPGVANPGVANPGVANPGVANPGVANESVTDASYSFTNEGNTSAAYTIQFFQSAPFPAGAKFQIILSKVYFTEQAVGCQIQQVGSNVIVANVTNPVFVSDPTQLGNPGVANLGVQTPTINLAPGESGQVTIRTNLSVAQVESQVLPNVSPVAVSRAVNTVDVQNGVFTPPINLVITSTSTLLALGEVNLPYNTTLTSIGGNSGARNWTIAAGSLPAGLQLNAASGVITGTPTQPGSFPFTVQAADTGTPQHTATRALTITIVPPVAITTPSPALAEGISGSQYTQTFSATGGVSFYRWSSTGTLPPGLTLATVGTSGLLFGTPTAGGTYNFIVRVTDALGAFASAPYTILITNPVPAGTQIQFVTQPAGTIGGQTISPAVTVRTLTATGAAIPNVPVAMSFGTQACAAAVLSGSPLTTTNASGIATFSDLIIDRGQNNYTLAATAGKVSALSSPFTVNGFCATGSLNTARGVHSAVALPNGTVLVAGGFASQNTPLASAEIYNSAAHSFTPVGNMNSARAFFTMTLLNNGLALVTGGFGSSGAPVSSAELFDPSTNTFTLVASSMTTPRAEHVATLLASGKVLITGGVSSTAILASADVFDPATNTFTPTTAPMTTARTVHNASLLANGQVLVTGGFGPAPLASAELYDPVANTFTATGSMATARGDHASALLYTGQVLVAGGLAPQGQGNTAATATAELYDPSTGLFTPTATALRAPRSFNGLPVPTLPDGTVLLTDGPTNGQIYDPASGTFQTTGSLANQDYQPRSVLLQDGTVLVTGGQDLSLNGLSDAEIYYSTASQAAIAITTASLAPASTGHAYTQLLLQKGGVGTLTWTETGTLPTGMAFSPQGLLSGTPTVAGSFPLTITVTDSSTPAKSASSNFTLAVADAPLVFTSSTVPAAVVGQPYVQALPVAGGTQPYNATVTSGTLPPGLSLSSGGVLNGTATGTGSFTFTVTVTDSSTPTKTATQTLTMGVNTLVITTTALPSGIVGVSYNAPINTGGGTPPLSFSLANTAFPPGLLIQQPSPASSSVTLAGTPTLAGTYTFSESVVDSSNPQQTATQNYVVTIVPAGSAVPANVTFVSQPQTSVGGQTLSGGPIVVQVTDANNSPVPGTTVAMTLGSFFSLAPACSVATISGALTAVTDATGRATFSNLSIDRGGFNYTLLAGTGSASGSSGPFSVKGFCASGNLSTPREEHTQVLLGTRQSTIKFPVDPRGTYLFTSPTDSPNPPLIISLASLGIKPGDVISAVSVGDEDPCGVGQFCSGEIFHPGFCGVFSSSNTLLPTGTLNRVQGAIAPNFTTAFSCPTPPTLVGNLPTDIQQDFGLYGEPVTVPPGAAYLFVSTVDTFYADNIDPNRDFGVALTVNSSSSVNGKVLMAGGFDNSGNALNTAELYDPALGFTTPTGNLTDPNGRGEQVSVVLSNGKVLLIGGVSNVSTLATAELYDPATGTFTPTGSMSQPRYYAAAVLLADGRVLVTGGFDTPVGSNTAEIYDPAAGLFTLTGNMNQGRGRHAMTLLPNGKVLVTGGRDNNQNFFALSSAEIFDPTANQGIGAFTPVGNMNSPRHVHASTLLSDGTVLVSGGFTGAIGSSSAVSAETFDPNTNVFTLTGNMSVSRSRHTSTLLPDGTVLVGAGVDRSGGISSAAPAELYSPTSRAFSPAGPMTTGREFHRATLLLNGTVLLGGGDDGVNVLASTEIYYNPVAQAPIAITATSVPNGIISQSYVQLLLEQGSAGPITWSLASGTLPPGITLGASGILSGTPTTVGSFTFTVQVTDGISTTTASFTINVSLATLAFTSNTMPAAGAAKPYSQPLPITGGTQPYNATVTSGTLPPGLALSSTGILSGTPSGAGSFTFTATVTDSSTPKQTATQTLTIAVNTLSIATTALPGGIVGVPYNAAITTVGGTLPLSFSAATASFPPGLTIQQPAANSQSGALAGTPTQAGHYTLSESVLDSSTPAQAATQYYLMDVSPAGASVPATVTFLSPPQNSIGGQILTGSPIRVHVTDANNAPITGASVAISFNGAPPCSSAVLSGTLNGITNGNGNAVFPDLSIDRGQLGYTLLATTGTASAVSQPFTVNGFCSVTTPAYVGSFAANTLLSNGKALVTGGVDVSGNLSAVAQLYDPATQTFTPTGSMQLPRREHTSTLLADGRVLVTGGRGGTAINSPTTATAEIYDPVAGTFTSTATPMNAPRRLHTATLLADGTVLLVGGRGIGADQNTAEIFDPKTNSFTLLTATLATARETHTATLLADGTVLLAGGSSGGATLSSAEIYNPSTRSFAAIPAPMNSPRSIFNTLLLPTGKALLVGGISDSTGTIATATAELYDPASATFKPTGSMSSARAFFTANSLPNGQVLAAGGLPAFTASSTDLATAEVYDSASGTFSQTGSLSSPRAQQTSVTLNDGTVLVTQGAGGSSDEIYYSTAPLAPLAITTTALANGVSGQPYTQILLEQGGVGTLSWTLTGGSLPTGIALSANGILSGTPTAAGSFVFTAQLADSSVPAKKTSVTFSLTVNGPTGLTVITKVLPSGVIGVSYFQILSAAGGAQPYSWSVIAGSLPTGLNLSNTGQISGTPTASGTFNCVVRLTDSAGTTVFQSLTITINPPLAITTASLPGSAPGVAYNQTLTAGGGAGVYAWSFVSGALPQGITLSSAGVLSGTPTTTGSFTFTVKVTDLSGKFTSASFTINITSGLPAGAHILFIIQPGRNVGPNGLVAGLVQLFDSNNAPISGAELAASFGARGCADAALTGTLTAVTDANGLATFSGITSTRGGQSYTAVVSATSNPNVSVTSNPFNINGFCPAASLSTLRREDTVALLPNGKVLIAGGLNNNGVPAMSLNSAEIYDPATGLSTPTGNMTTARDLATATVLPNGHVLIAGGYDATGATLATAELFDPGTGVFTATGSMSVPRQEHTATLLPNGKVLIAGGVKWAFPTTFYASAEIYDPATGQFALTGTMNSPHVDHTATLLSNGKVLVASGEGSTNPDASNQQITSSAELYDPSTGTFTPTGSMTTGRFNQAATTLFDGRVLVTGGYADVNTRTATASAEIYDPSAGTFSPSSSMNVARAEQSSTALPNGDILIAGGFSSLGFFGGTQLSTAEIYNPSTGSFKGPANMAFAHSRVIAPLLPNGAVLLASGTTAELFFPTDPPFLVQEFTGTGNLNTGRVFHTATLLSNGLVLIAGGRDPSGNASASAELYNPISGAFTATGNLNTGRDSHTATLLSNGLVLIAGGEGSAGTVASAEIYNPATGTFTATGSLNTGRFGHTTTLLSNGQVLIAGGTGSSGGAFASAELYNPATGTFTATGSLNTARFRHTATLLNNGLVLITGGVTSLSVVMAGAELYNPASGTFSATGSLNTGRSNHTATLLNNGLVLIAGGFSGGALAGAELYNPATGAFTATGSLNTGRADHTATLLPTGKVLIAAGQGQTGPQATSELYQFGANQQLQPQSCSYEGHIKSVAAFSTPTAVRFVNNSATLTYQVFWLDYNGNRVLYATLPPGQSLVQQTFLTHPWVIADTSPAATCQEIYFPLQEQAPAIFPPAQ